MGTLAIFAISLGVSIGVSSRQNKRFDFRRCAIAAHRGRG